MKSQQLTSAKNNKAVAKISKILNSIAQLFQPFKEVLINILPSAKFVVRFLDFCGRALGGVVLLIARIIPYIFTFIKGKVFKIILIVIVLLVFINTITSRIINTPGYKHTLARAIEDATGYRTVIEGKVSINFLLLTISVNNAAFYSPISKSSEIALNLLSVNSLKIKFSLMSLFTGHLRAKNININKAEVRYKFVATQMAEDKFISQIAELNSITNLTMIDTENVSKGKVSDSASFINNLNNINAHPSYFNTEKETTVLPRKVIKDDYKRYLNLKGVFVNKQNEESPVFVNIDNNQVVYKFLANFTHLLQVDVSLLKKLTFNNVLFKIVDSNDKPIIVIDNLQGTLKKHLFGKHTLRGEGRFLNKDMFFNFASFNTQEGKGIDLILSYTNDNFKSKDIIIDGVMTQNNQLSANIAFSGAALDNLLVQNAINSDFLLTKSSFVKAKLLYQDSVLQLSDGNLTINDSSHGFNLLYNFSGSGIMELDLNLSLNQLDTLLQSLNHYKHDKHERTFASINNLLLSWYTNHKVTVNPKFFAINLTVDNTNLNGLPLSRFVLKGFLDNNDNFYVNNLMLRGDNLETSLQGKIQLVNKTGTMLISSQGNLDNLCAYMSCNDNLKQFVLAIAGGREDYKLRAKMFLNEDRIVFNDINGNLGKEAITTTHATFIERMNSSDLIISSKLAHLDILDLYRIYNFNKSVGRLYYNDNNNLMGIPNNFKIHLNLYSDTLSYKNLNFYNFEMESSIISSGILIHNFNFTDNDRTGSVRGSFNFNDKVTPSIVGNINFTNMLFKADAFNDIILNNYKLAGKVLVNGNINVAGDNYYNGVNKINGKLALLKYERLKVNKENNTPGFYITILKIPYQGKDYYQIGDLYGNLTISNNVINFSPSVVRFLHGKDSYRGSLTGVFDLLANSINLHSTLHHETNGRTLDFLVKGDLYSAQVTADNSAKR